MQTIILCGGEGTRLMPKTQHRPKPMVEVGGKPLLWHIMKIYAHYGFNDFILATGYKGDFIKNYFSKNKKDDLKIKIVDTGLKSLTGERIRRIGKYIKGDNFMVTYGDGLANVDVNELVKFHDYKKSLATITGVHPRHRFGLVSVDTNNFITGFQQKPILSDIVNGGFMVFSKKALDYIKKDSMIEDVFPLLAKDRRLALYPHNGFWFAIDTYRDLLDANDLWKSSSPWKVWS